MSYDLTRFLKAQDEMFVTALCEIRRGYKQSRWMWFIFPSFKELGTSSSAKYYGLESFEEAKEYFQNETLKERLEEVTNELLNLEFNDPNIIFGAKDTDIEKLQASMTIFNRVSNEENSIFKKVLDKFYNGEENKAALDIINRA